MGCPFRCWCSPVTPWGPPWLLSDAERHLTSSLTGLLIAAVPIIGVIAARVAGDTAELGAMRWARLALGLAGVTVLAAPHLGGRTGWPLAEVLLVALGYAVGPLIAARWCSPTSTRRWRWWPGCHCWASR